MFQTVGLGNFPGRLLSVSEDANYYSTEGLAGSNPSSQHVDFAAPSHLAKLLAVVFLSYLGGPSVILRTIPTRNVLMVMFRQPPRVVYDAILSVYPAC